MARVEPGLGPGVLKSSAETPPRASRKGLLLRHVVVMVDMDMDMPLATLVGVLASADVFGVAHLFGAGRHVFAALFAHMLAPVLVVFRGRVVLAAVRALMATLALRHMRGLFGGPPPLFAHHRAFQL